MKTRLAAILAVLSVASTALPAASLQPGDVVAICGDSITEQKLYSVYIESYLLMCQPVPVRCVQFGQGGAPASNLRERAPRDLALFHPTVATTMYGMNDGQYQPLNDERASSFRRNMGGAIDELQKLGVRTIIVGSPSAVDWVGREPDTVMYNRTLTSLGEISREVAGRKGATFAEVHAVMERAIAAGRTQYGPGFSTGGDGTHAGPAGHLMIAYAFLTAMGCDGAIGTITVDLAAGTAKGDQEHRILSMQDGTVEIESSRYPYCFDGEPGRAEPTTTAVLPLLPFNEDLNRYTLVVRGLGKARARVNWGGTHRDFTAAELEKGVNLAAAFVPVNPFSGQFARVAAAVLEQQTAETILTVNFLNSAMRLRKAIPTQSAAFDAIQLSGMTQAKRLADAARALVTPVRHAITIAAID